ncbi:MAG: hypothetical protein ACTS4Y_01850 [Candidatus Hodgkinia cicadicola]
MSLRVTLVLPQMKKFNRLGPNAITSRSLVGRMFAPARLLQAVQNAVEPLAMTKMAGAFIANEPLRTRSQPLCLRSRPFRPSRLASASKVPKLNTFPNFRNFQTSLPPLNNVRLTKFYNIRRTFPPMRKCGAQAHYLRVKVKHRSRLCETF